jgi:hypothetical protein
MSSPLRKLARSTMLAAIALAVAPAAWAETVEPLPEAEYTTRSACAAPTPGRAGCLALQLIPVTPEALRRRHPLGIVRRASSASPASQTPAGGFLGLRPQDLHAAYSLPSSAPVAQTVALVDAYNDPRAEADLKTYDEEFGLPECTSANGCFKKVSQTGSESELPFPKTLVALETAAKGSSAERERAKEAIGWGVEISLDVQSARAICQSCHILLVEANSPTNADLVAAENRAAALGATEISNSWGTPEEAVEELGESEAFNKPGTVITASAGDDGYREWGREEGAFTSFPAASPHVVAVGGTRLQTLGIGGGWQGETVWNGSGASGGGCSTVFPAPSWQLEAATWSSVGCGEHRAANDIAADADPYTGVVIRDTANPGKECQELYEEGGVRHTIANWCTYGGTSLASPIVAAVFALAGGSNGVAYPAQTLYQNLRAAPSSFHDVTVGSNGECEGFDEETGLSWCTPAQEAETSCASQLKCLAGVGYDGPSGVGTPNEARGFIPGQFEAPLTPAASAAPSTTVPPSAPPSAPAVVPTPPVLRLTSLGLTTPSVIALNRSPTAAKISFTFNTNIPVRLRVTLEHRVSSHGRRRWVAIGHASTVNAAVGRNVKRLTGGRRLKPGLYRLTLTPAGGKPRSVLFHIG